MNYSLVVIATVLLAAEFACSKKYQIICGTSPRAGFRFNLLSGLGSAIIFLILCGLRPGFSWFSAGMALAQALSCVAYSLLGFTVLETGGMAIYTIFLMSGGMLLPYLFGVLFLDEVLTFPRIVGAAVLLLGVICSNGAKFRLNAKLLLPCIGVFFLNGTVSILSKCHQVSAALSPVSATAFVMYAGLGKALCSGTALLFMKPENTPQFRSRAGLPVTAAAALFGGLSYLLQLMGAKALPASVLYPMVTGGGILFSALTGCFLFRERLTPSRFVGIALCFIGTLLFL